ncbi:MAG TPA: hypothetical protein VG253_15465 [Streptosporangiaceae bacterium]|nr:hypothetical protein [Streptosporangiaceae bacterium]
MSSDWTWVRTVARETPILVAMLLVSSPSTSNPRHSRSRPVRYQASRCASLLFSAGRAGLVLGTSTTTSPRCTRSIAAVSAATPLVLCRYPAAPAFSACRTPSVSGSALSMRTFVSGLAASILLMASIPLLPAK